MQELHTLLLALDHLYFTASAACYEQERQKVAAHIQQLLPGFTIAYAIELGTVGAGEETYQHGGIAHVLVPVQEHSSRE
jgi:hypothetical protein